MAALHQALAWTAKTHLIYDVMLALEKVSNFRSILIPEFQTRDAQPALDFHLTNHISIVLSLLGFAFKLKLRFHVSKIHTYSILIKKE